MQSGLFSRLQEASRISRIIVASLYHTYACVYACMHVWLPVCLSVWLAGCTYVCMYICMSGCMGRAGHGRDRVVHVHVYVTFMCM